jgi:hypothetical protein
MYEDCSTSLPRLYYLCTALYFVSAITVTISFSRQFYYGHLKLQKTVYIKRSQGSGLCLFFHFPYIFTISTSYSRHDVILLLAWNKINNLNPGHTRAAFSRRPKKIQNAEERSKIANNAAASQRHRKEHQPTACILSMLKTNAVTRRSDKRTVGTQ